MERQFPDDSFDRPDGNSSRIGSELRAARERLGWPIDGVADALRIKVVYLKAIEEGDIRNLPGTAYAVGFVRNYAQAVGLDSNEAIRRFRAERAEVNRKTELDFPAPVPTRGVPAGVIVLVGVIVAIGGYIGWYHYSGRGARSVQTAEALPAHLEPLAPPATPKPPALAVAKPPASAGMKTAAAAPGAALPPADQNVSPSSAAAAVPPAPAAGGAGTAGLAANAGGSAPAAGGQSASSQAAAIAANGSGPGATGTGPGAAGTGSAGAVALAQPAVPGAAGGVSPAVDQVGPAGGAPMVVQATADAWIEIKNAQGRVLYQAILHPGDKYTVPDQPQLTLTTGNAAGTEVVLAGNVIGPLKGHVLHNVPLDAQSLRAASGDSMTPASPGAAAAPAAAPAAPASAQ